MPTMAEAVSGAAQNAVTQQGRTVGDALDAYKMSVTTENARRELEMQKQNADLNKANWIAGQYDKIGRTAGPAQQLLINSFGKQMQQIQPGFNTQTLDVLKKDPDTLRNITGTTARMLSRGSISDPEQAQALLAMHNGDLDAFMGSATKMGEENAKIEAARLGVAQVRAQQLEEQKRQHALTFGEHAESNKIIQLSKQNVNSLNRSESILNGNLPVTSKDLALAYNDYINAVAAGGAATEGKIQRELPETAVQGINELIQKYASKNVDLRKTSAGAALISQLGGRITGVKSDINGAIENQGQIFHDIGVKSGNPYVAEQAKDILMRYSPKAYAKTYGGKTAAEPSAPPPTNYGSTPKDIEDAYAQFKAQQAHQAAQAGGGQ